MTRLFLVYLFLPQLLIAQVLTEICPLNSSGFKHDEFGYCDWIEIHNPSEVAINLSDWYLTDDLSNPDKYQFHDLYIGANTYRILPAIDENDFPNVINFSFSRNGQRIYLLTPTFVVKDSLIQPGLMENHSYGKVGTSCFYFDSPTPGVHNNTLGYKGYAHEPEINRSSGEMNIGTHLMVHALNEDETVFFYENGSQIEMEATNPMVLTDNVNYRFMVKGDSLINSSFLTRTYFVEANHELPLINLTLDSLDLFDAYTGIYMLGEEADSVYPFLGANFWEDEVIPIHFEYFDENLNLKESVSCHLEIHGGYGSRTKEMKSFSLKAKDRYQNKEFTYSFFDEKEVSRFKRLVLRNGGNDFCHTGILDGVLHEHFMKTGLNIDLLGFQPCVVYINGAYWGNYNLREKMDKYYLWSNYDIDLNDVNILENRTLNVLEGDATGFIELIEYAESYDLSIQEHYDWIADRMDLNSMIDYFIVELYTNNRDWPNNNLRVWNVPGVEKWRYLCYDLDVAFTYSGGGIEKLESLRYIMDNLIDINPHVSLFNELLKNETFKFNFINRYASLLNTALSSQVLINVFEEEKEKLKSEIEIHYSKWCGSLEVWHDRFVGLYGAISKRKEIIESELSSVFDISEIVEIKLNSYPKKGVEIRTSTTVVPELPFKCKFYPEVPLEIEALSTIGLEFDYWENVRTGERFYRSLIELNVQEGDHFVAVFKTEKLFDLKCQPNPILDQAIISFDNPTSEVVNIELTTIDGRIVKNIFDDFMPKGACQQQIDISYFESGVYLLSVSNLTEKEVIKVVKY